MQFQPADVGVGAVDLAGERDGVRSTQSSIGSRCCSRGERTTGGKANKGVDHWRPDLQGTFLGLGPAKARGAEAREDK